MYSRFYVRNIGDYFGVFVFYDNADDTCDYLLLCPVLEREASAEGRASIFSVCTRIYYYIRGDSAVGKEYTFSLIEKAKKEDLKEILELQYLAYQSEAKLFGNMEIPPLKQTLEEVYGEFERGIVLKALDENGVIIGSVRAYQDGGTVYIGKLMVHPKMQKKGIGTKLLLEMEKEYPNQRYELYTSTKSISNIRLYERLGYKIFKEEAVTSELQFVYMQKSGGIHSEGIKSERI